MPTWIQSPFPPITLPVSIAQGGTGNTTGTASNLAGGFLSTSVVKVTTTYTILQSDCLVMGDASGGNFTVTLPTPVGITGKIYTVLNFGGAGTVTVGTAGGHIGGSGGGTSFGLFFQFDLLQVQSDGANWQIVGRPVTQGSQAWSGNKQFSDGIFVSNGTTTDSFRVVLVTKAGGYTATDTDFVVLVNGAFTITLPTAVPRSGRLYTVKQVAAAVGTVATTGGQTIDGAANYSLSAQNKYVTVVSDGANWQIVANN